MKRKMIVVMVPVVVAVLLALGLSSASARMESKEKKAVFDFRIAAAKSASLHMGLIHQTYKDMSAMQKDMKPSFVVVFIGPSVRLISTNKEGMSEEDKRLMDEMASTVSAMAKDGIRFEICLVAAKVMGVDPKTVLPEIRHVENGWISLIDYQSKGYYPLVPVY